MDGRVLVYQQTCAELMTHCSLWPWLYLVKFQFCLKLCSSHWHEHMHGHVSIYSVVFYSVSESENNRAPHITMEKGSLSRQVMKCTSITLNESLEQPHTFLYHKEKHKFSGITAHQVLRFNVN